MQIIFLSTTKVASLQLSRWQISVCIMTLFLLGAACAWFIQPLLLTSIAGHTVEAKTPVHIQEISPPDIAAINHRIEKMQEHIEQLNHLGTRLSHAIGSVAENNAQEIPLPLPQHEQNASIPTFSPILNNIAQRINFDATRFNQLETRLAARQLQSLSNPRQMATMSIIASNTSAFGWRHDPLTGLRTFHEGIDIAAPEGRPIMAVAPGKVISAKLHAGYGLAIDIDHGNGIMTRYAHVSYFAVQAGDHVKTGQIIGSVGRSGRVTGAHLHFEIRIDGVAQNPEHFLVASLVKPVPHIHSL
ncbi:MAG: M23 family metallopeptidase [Ottowia sp.]|nr:M23 family metallopeptidase [Ottowia sp.]